MKNLSFYLRLHFRNRDACRQRQAQHRVHRDGPPLAEKVALCPSETPIKTRWPSPQNERDSSLIATARRSPSFPRSSVGRPCATLRVVCPTSHPRRTQSVPDGIPTRSVGTSLSPLQSPGYQEKPVEISEKSRMNSIRRPMGFSQMRKRSVKDRGLETRGQTGLETNGSRAEAA
jgi:hypothetical protein